MTAHGYGVTVLMGTVLFDAHICDAFELGAWEVLRVILHCCLLLYYALRVHMFLTNTNLMK